MNPKRGFGCTNTSPTLRRGRSWEREMEVVVALLKFALVIWIVTSLIGLAYVTYLDWKLTRDDEF